MKIVKLALISVAGLIIVVLLLSALLPSKVRISRATDIHGSKEEISQYVANLPEWKKWNAMANDTALSGAKFNPDQITHENMNIRLEHASTDSVIVLWHRNNTNTRSGFNFYESTQGPVVVQWYFDFNLRWYPWEKFASIIFDKQLGHPMEKSLAALKEAIERRPE